MKRRAIKTTLLIAVIVAFCCSFLHVNQTHAKEETYEWPEVKCILMAPPYKYSEYNNVSFQIFFDKNVTDVNYKHMAASAAVLKTMDKYNNPNMTARIADSLERDGIIDSINDCITFNGKKVREWQKTSPLACMVAMGELGANNSINLDFNGAFDDVRIEDLNQKFVITLHKGLKFPSGVEVKEDVTWEYDPVLEQFSEVPAATDDKDSAFAAYYNGQEVTPEDNTVLIYDKEAFSLNNLKVYPKSVSATYTVEPMFDDLAEGQNYLMVTCVAGNRYDSSRMQMVFDLQPQVTSYTKWGHILFWGKIVIAIILVAGSALFSMNLIKRRKRS